MASSAVVWVACIGINLITILHNTIPRSSNSWPSVLSKTEWHLLNKANNGSNRSLIASQSAISAVEHGQDP